MFYTVFKQQINSLNAWQIAVIQIQGSYWTRAVEVSCGNTKPVFSEYCEWITFISYNLKVLSHLFFDHSALFHLADQGVALCHSLPHYWYIFRGQPRGLQLMDARGDWNLRTSYRYSMIPIKLSAGARVWEVKLFRRGHSWILTLPVRFVGHSLTTVGILGEIFQ